jgi:hypothetical protein
MSTDASDAGGNSRNGRDSRMPRLTSAMNVEARRIGLFLNRHSILRERDGTSPIMFERIVSAKITTTEIVIRQDFRGTAVESRDLQ